MNDPKQIHYPTFVIFFYRETEFMDFLFLKIINNSWLSLFVLSMVL